MLLLQMFAFDCHLKNDSYKKYISAYIRKRSNEYLPTYFFAAHYHAAYTAHLVRSVPQATHTDMPYLRPRKWA